MHSYKTTDQITKSEQHILQGLILKPEYLREYHQLKADLFGNEANRSVFLAMEKVIKKCGYVDEIEIMNWLDGSMLQYYLDLTINAVTAADFETRLNELIEASKIRNINNAVSLFQNNQLTLKELKKTIDQEDSREIEKDDDEFNPEEFLSSVISKDVALKCPGFYKLFNSLNISKNTLNLIGAVSGEGKSLLAQNLFNQMLNIPEYYPVYFNLEISEPRFRGRFLSMNTGLRFDEFKYPENKNKLLNFLNSLKANGFNSGQILTGSKSLEDISRIISRAVRKHPGRHVIVFVDLLSQIKLSGFNNEREKMAEISKSLLALTKDLDCTIFLLQQLNREAMKGVTGQATFKGTGQAVEDSDNALILTDFNKKLLDANHATYNNHYFQIEAVKARNAAGMTRIALRAEMPTQRMEEIEYYDYPEWVKEKM